MTPTPDVLTADVLAFEGLAFDRDRIPSGLERLTRAEVLARWREPDRTRQNPRLVVTINANGE